jgi:hypothetical protein
MKTADAFNHLAEQIRDDPSYFQAWQANFAMPILDGCKSAGIAMTHAQANALADRLMAHLFDLPTQKVKAAYGVAIEV